MDKQQIDLRGIAQRDGSSFEPVTELSEEQLSIVSGGKGGTKAPPVPHQDYIEVKLETLIISS